MAAALSVHTVENTIASRPTLFLWALTEAYRTVPLKPATVLGWTQHGWQSYSVAETYSNSCVDKSHPAAPTNTTLITGSYTWLAVRMKPFLSSLLLQMFFIHLLKPDQHMAAWHHFTSITSQISFNWLQVNQSVSSEELQAAGYPLAALSEVSIASPAGSTAGSALQLLTWLVEIHLCYTDGSSNQLPLRNTSWWPDDGRRHWGQTSKKTSLCVQRDDVRRDNVQPILFIRNLKPGRGMFLYATHKGMYIQFLSFLISLSILLACVSNSLRIDEDLFTVRIWASRFNYFISIQVSQTLNRK